MTPDTCGSDKKTNQIPEPSIVNLTEPSGIHQDSKSQNALLLKNSRFNTRADSPKTRTPQILVLNVASHEYNQSNGDQLFPSCDHRWQFDNPKCTDTRRRDQRHCCTRTQSIKQEQKIPQQNDLKMQIHTKFALNHGHTKTAYRNVHAWIPRVGNNTEKFDKTFHICKTLWQKHMIKQRTCERRFEVFHAFNGEKKTIHVRKYENDPYFIRDAHPDLCFYAF